FTKEAMTLLSRSAEARQEAVELAATQHITAQIARELLRKHLPTAGKPKPARHFIQGDGFLLTITTPGEQTPEQIAAILLTAARLHREGHAPPAAQEMADAPAIVPTRSASPFDRFRRSA